MKTALPRLIAIILLAVAGHASAADVGRVLLAAGDTVAVRDKQIIKLVFGSAVQDKDLLRTGPASNLQVRFLDESILSMRESSEIRIDEFRFAGKEDGTERAFFSLLKGGLRKVTGIIGRTNHKNYQMGSVVATIGVRGTDYATTLCQQDCRNPDGTLAKDGQYGRVHAASFGTSRLNISNEKDERTLSIRQNFYVADAKSLVEPLLVAPDFVANRLEGRKQPGKPPAGTGQEQAAVGGVQQESRGQTAETPVLQPVHTVAPETGTGGPAAGPPVTAPTTAAALSSTPISALVFAFSAPDADLGDTAELSNFPGGTILLDSTGTKLEAASVVGSLPDFVTVSASISRSGAAFFDLNSHDPGDGRVFWGRWGPGAVATASFDDLEETFSGSLVPPTGIHWIFGPATAHSVIAAKTGMVNYLPAGGTNPTHSSGAVGTFTGGSFSVNFTMQTLGGNLNYSVASNAYMLSVPSTTPIYNSNGAAVFGIDPGPVGGFCSPGCSAPTGFYSVGGVFTGATGKGLGVTYATDHPNAGQTAGAQFFKQ